MEEFLRQFSGHVVVVDVASIKKEMVGGRYNRGEDDCWYLRVKEGSGKTVEDLYTALKNLQSNSDEMKQAFAVELLNRPNDGHSVVFQSRPELRQFGLRGKLVLLKLKLSKHQAFASDFLSTLNG